MSNAGARFPSIGSDRFRILSCLGEGAHGIVYEVLDLRSQARIALKMLRRSEPYWLLRFKREFRALVGIHHPNLVRLGELFEWDGSWFFTMELVQGSNFLDYIRSSTQAETTSLAGERFAPNQRHRLNTALLQLSDALETIHRAGLVHRDVKPSNIRITPADRLVLLDFGLVSSYADGDLVSTAERIVGTVAYMAPEQAAGEALTPAADLYAVGVLLYEALTGRLPFQGGSVEVLYAKQSRDAPDPANQIRDAPTELVDLCRELLARDPRARPDAAALRARLGGRPIPRSRQKSGRWPHGRSPSRIDGPQATLFGRESELALLEQCLARGAQGQIVVVRIEGESGVGKTALVRAFVDALAAERPDCTVLLGNCYTQERVPYNAFDAAIDALGKRLSGLPEEACARVLPRHASLLPVLFPALARVFAIANAKPAPGVGDPITVRQHAFAALRELFDRMCEHGQVVLLLEDLHWADAESLELLRALVQEPDPPPLLLIVTAWRRQDCSAEQYQKLDGVLLNANATLLELGRLPAAASLALTLSLLEGAGVSVPDRAERIVREANGHPLFIERLVRSAIAGILPDEGIDGALSNEIAHLTEGARRILHLLAIADAAVAERTLARAFGLEPGEFDAALALLMRSKLARVQSSGSDRTIGLYHARIRRPAVARLEQAYIRRSHFELAAALEADKSTDFEALALHWAEAGKLERAGSYFVQAADVAAQALAFGHAAVLYQRALLLLPEHERRELRVKLGHALASTGRSGEAAEEFLAAAVGASGPDALELQRLGAHYLLRGGRVDRGLQVARNLLSGLSIPLPKTRASLLASLVWERMLLSARGLHFEPCPPAPEDRHEASVSNALWSIGSAISYVDVLVGAYLHTRALRRALDLGDPLHIARSLALEGMYGVDGDNLKARGVIATAESLAHRLGDPFSIAYVKLSWAICYTHEADVVRALDAADEAARLLEQHRDAAWELGLARMVGLAASVFMGQFRSSRERFQAALRVAEERGDLFGVSTLFGMFYGPLGMVDDRVDECEKELCAAISRWPVKDSMQHRYALINQVMLDLYRGGGAAHERIEQAWPAHQRSLLLRYQRLRIISLMHRGLSALDALVAGSCKQSKALKLVEECAKRLARESVADATGTAHVLRAQACHFLGQHSRAVDHYRTAIRHLEPLGVAFARTVKQRLAGIVGGDEARIILSDNEAWAEQQGIRRLERFFAATAPVV